VLRACLAAASLFRATPAVADAPSAAAARAVAVAAQKMQVVAVVTCRYYTAVARVFRGSEPLSTLRCIGGGLIEESRAWFVQCVSSARSVPTAAAR
jgi:hypothetical protein